MDNAAVVVACLSNVVIGDYPPSHSWYYKLGNRPLSPNEIRKSANALTQEEWALVINYTVEDYVTKKGLKLTKLKEDLEKYKTELVYHIERYNDLRKGFAYLNENIFWNNMSGYFMALSLKHNHIFYCYRKTLILNWIINNGLQTRTQSPSFQNRKR